MSKFISLIKSLFVSDPGKKIRKQLDIKYKQAVEFQRNGKLREYGQVMKEIEDLEKEYVEVVSVQENV